MRRPSRCLVALAAALALLAVPAAAEILRVGKAVPEALASKVLPQVPDAKQTLHGGAVAAQVSVQVSMKVADWVREVRERV